MASFQTFLVLMAKLRGTTDGLLFGEVCANCLTIEAFLDRQFLRLLAYGL